MARMVGISGIDELKAGLARIGREAATAIPTAAARALATLATEAFNKPDLRPKTWPPLADSTLARAGAASDKARKARKRAAEYRSDAYGHDFAAGHLEGRARKSALRKAETARKKAREWRGKAKEAKGAAAGGRKMLYDSGALFRSIMASGNRVVSDREYAVYHQFGSADGKHPPARPFVPVKEDGTLVDKAARILRADIESGLVRIARQCGLK